MCKSTDQETLFDNLSRPLDLNSLNDSSWSDKCNYIETDKCTNINPENYNLVVIQLNIHSLLSKQTELKQLLRNLERKNPKVDLIFLCETFLDKKNVKLVNLPGYNLVSNERVQKVDMYMYICEK